MEVKVLLIINDFKEKDQIDGKKSIKGQQVGKELEPGLIILFTLFRYQGSYS